MKRLKQILIGIIFSALLIPMIKNNVHAETYEIPNMDNYTEHLLDSGSKYWHDGTTLSFSSAKVDVTDYDYIKVEVSTPATSVCVNPWAIYAKWNLSLVNNFNIKQEYYLVNGKYAVGTAINASKDNIKNVYIFDTRNTKSELYLDGTFNGRRVADNPESTSTGHQHYASGYYSIVGLASKKPVFSGDLASGNLMFVEYIHHLSTYSGYIDKL